MKIFRKPIFLWIVLAVFLVALGAWRLTEKPAPSDTPMPTINDTAPALIEVPSTHEPKVPTHSERPQHNDTNYLENAEPPLSKADSTISVPAFLTPDQQDLYRRAHSLVIHMIGTSIEYEETLKMEKFPPKEYDTVKVGEKTYVISQGRYSDWKDFNAVVHSIFTNSFWDIYNNSDSSAPKYVEHNGKLCFIDSSMGVGYFYSKNVPDEFRLEEKTDTAIMFTLIGHYNLLGAVEGETEENKKARLLRGYDYTIEFPMKMILKENGWRFDEFHSALLEETEPK